MALFSLFLRMYLKTPDPKYPLAEECAEEKAFWVTIDQQGSEGWAVVYTPRDYDFDEKYHGPLPLSIAEKLAMSEYYSKLS